MSLFDMEGLVMSLTVKKGLRLLEALCAAREPVGVTDLARQIDLNLSAVQRLLGTLVETGYAEQDPRSRKYRATLLMWEVGAKVLAENHMRRNIHPILRQAAHQTGFNAFFVLNNCPFITYFDKVEGHIGLTYSAEIGSSLPMTQTAGGLAISAFLPPEDLEKLFSPAQRGTVNFQPVDRNRLMGRIAPVRERRYATSESGVRRGVNSIAAPVWRQDGYICGSITLTADESDLPADRFADFGLKVVRWAEEATTMLGGQPFPASFYQAYHLA
jgi:DNA-binding IclR family transcriptional regulator